MRYDKLKKMIRHSYNDLPKNQKKIADFIIENFDKIPFQSVQDISKSTSTSVATVVRFSQRIGFSGFSEMREHVAENLQNHLQSNEIFPLLDAAELAKDTLTAVANQEIKNIKATLNLIERPNFRSVVKLILNAGRIYTMGLGISNLLSQILSYQLTQVGIDAYPFRHDYTSFPEQLLCLKSDDIIVAFSFPPYSKETIDTTKIANERGVKVIAITNRSASPITIHSQLNLCVRSENMLFTNSFSAISVLINAISTECAVENRKRAESMMKEMNDAINGQNLIIE